LAKEPKPAPDLAFNDFNELLAAFLKRKYKRRYLEFLPGQYGNCDLFCLKEFKEDGQPIEIAEPFSSDPDNETLACLQLLDKAVATHREVIFCGSTWSRTPSKQEGHYRENVAVSLFSRRLLEQRLILDKEIWRGHKSFGFYLLEGGT
jgi:hypothetical protein